MSRYTKGLLFLVAMTVAALHPAPSRAVPVETPDWVTKVYKPDAEGNYIDGDSIIATSFSFAQPQGTPLTALCPLKVFQFNTSGGANCWGWRGPDGTEYGIMGTRDGVAFVNTNTMTVVEVVPGPTGSVCGGIIWRELKSYQNYCYVASECTGTNQGIMIIDMQYLPDSVHYIKSHFTATDIRSHCLSIDTVKGYLYAVKQNYSGFRVISLANPANPVEVGSVTTGDLHDITAHNDKVYAAEANNKTFSIWNMANKTAGQLIVRITIPAGGYVHNIWPSADGSHVATTEETANKTVKWWDISNPANVQLKQQFLGTSNLAHNAHIQGNRLYLSHYQSGVYVLDISNPDTLIPLTKYDTYSAGEGPSFNGCWGVYPHTASGNVYASNIEGQFYIFSQTTLTDVDTIRGDSLFASANQNVTVQIKVKNHQPIKSITIPMNWTGPYNMTYVGVSTAGCRTSYFQNQQYTVYDPSHNKIAYTLDVGGAADLPPGDGPVLNLILRIPPGASGPINPIALDPFNSTPASITTDCFTYVPELKAPSVIIGAPPSCCIGTRGNVDNSPDQAVDIADLSALIDHLFISLGPISCDQEANLDGSPESQVDISDLSLLIDKLFVNPSSDFPACP
jgi:choice-of-anchor B domain-containing protein